MVTLEQVAAMAGSLPGVQQGERHGHRTWFVGRKAIVWERPFSKADLKRFGDIPPPEGPIIAIAVADLHEKEALLAAGEPGLFTIPHFDGYAAVLVQLRQVRAAALEELLADGWRTATCGVTVRP